MFAQRRGGTLAIGRLALEGVVDRLAERVPELLLVAALQRHRLGFGLPALLERLDGVDAQLRRSAQLAGLGDHLLATLDAGLLRGLERAAGGGHGLVPLRLQFGENLLAHVARIAPAVGELVQAAVARLQVVVGMGGSPGLELLDQRQALRAVLGGVGAHLLQPGLDHLVGLVAGLVEALPQRVVGGAALVGLLPLLAQGAQLFLHLATAQCLTVGAVEQALGLGDEFLAHLVGAPALPAFELAGGHQRGMHACLELVADQAAVFLEHRAQRGGSTLACLAVALGGFLLELGQRRLHGLLGRGTGRRVDLGRSGLGRCRRHRFERHPARGADLVGPDRHWRQRRGGVRGRGHGLRQRAVEGVRHHLQLRLRGVELRGEAGVEAAPVGVLRDLLRLGQPVLHVAAQALLGRLRVLPALGRQHLEALREQHRRLAVDLRAVLQVLDPLDPLGQLRLEAGQRLARERGAGLGGVALPGHGVGDVQARLLEQRARLVGPLGGDRLLALGALDLVEPLAQRTGGALVAPAELLEDLLHQLRRRIGGEPVADALRSLARGGRGEGAARELVEGRKVVFGGSLGHCA
ncbi:Uncharacterised protein [Xylophilus ampelinus]|nr:Uncharacterised protein [Xylophilus ampelinus]